MILKESQFDVVDCNFKATSKNENKCKHKVLVIHSKNTNKEKVTRANGGCLGF